MKIASLLSTATKDQLKNYFLSFIAKRQGMIIDTPIVPRDQQGPYSCDFCKGTGKVFLNRYYFTTDKKHILAVVEHDDQCPVCIGMGTPIHCAAESIAWRKSEKEKREQQAADDAQQAMAVNG